ncbi:MAG: Uncharacterised protein [Synechococcus sp. CC9902]|nr:MAG: Uncharacterised protein [Synechococcus sp. CC9902]
MNHSGAFQQVGKLAGQLDTGGSRTDNHQRSIGLTLLAQPVDAFPQPGDIIKAAKSLGVMLDPGDAEIIRLRAGGQHKIAPLQSAAMVRVQPASVQINPTHPFLQPDHLA